MCIRDRGSCSSWRSPTAGTSLRESLQSGAGVGDARLSTGPRPCSQSFAFVCWAKRSTMQRSSFSPGVQ
eukprot:1403162-Alexandrium_andersonii.AAC.1